MHHKELNKVDKNILERLLEYCKYLYEGEKERTERLEKKLNIYSLVLGSSIMGILILPAGKLAILFSNPTQSFGIITIVFFFISFLLYLFSTVFTILVYKVQRFERPSDPKIAALNSLSMENEKDMLSAIIADYTTAANRNHEINDKKAKYLSKVLFFLLGGLICFALGFCTFNISTLFKGV